MFGGIAFMVRGHMSVGIVKDDLMVRVGPEQHERLVREPKARPMDFTGKPMKGFLYLASPGFESDADLERWVGEGLSYAESLPPKDPSAKRPPASRGARRGTNRPATPASRARNAVDAYIAKYPPEVQAALQRVRRAIRKALPDAEEAISYQIPTYKRQGRYVIYFAGWKQHYSVYPAKGPVLTALKKELAPYEISKGTIRFPLSEPVPERLIGRIAKLLAKAAGERSNTRQTAQKRTVRKGAARRKR